MDQKIIQTTDLIMKVNTYIKCFGNAMTLMHQNSPDTWNSELIKIKERAQKGEINAIAEMLAMNSIAYEDALLSGGVDEFSQQMLTFAQQNGVL